MKRILFSLAILAFIPSCNTAVGVGRDMRVLGTEMEKKAEQSVGGGSSDAGGAPVY